MARFMTTEPTQDQLATEIRHLGNALGEVIVGLEGQAVLDLEEKLRRLAKKSRLDDSKDAAVAQAELEAAIDALSTEEARQMAMAFTVYFELVNLAEENHRVRLLRERRRKGAADPSLPPMRETIAAALAELKQKGATPAEIQKIVDGLLIELVFTAHPTESKRRTMLNKLQRLAERLRHSTTEEEVTGRRDQHSIAREVTSLWLTDRSRTSRPEVTDEVLTGLWYFETNLWETMPFLQAEMEQALAKYYPEVKAPNHWIAFGSWMGGDRDGNPNVTPKITAETLSLHRGMALKKMENELKELSRFLSVSTQKDGISAEMKDLLSKFEEEIKDPFVANLRARQPHESYRLILAGLRSLLLDAQKSNGSAALLATGEAAKTLKTPDLLGALEVMRESLLSHRAASLATGEFQHVVDQAKIFGLSLSRLDVRQHSGRHESAVTEVLKKAGFCEDYSKLSEDERMELLKKLLAQPAPSLATDYTKETHDVIGSLTVFKRAIELYGEEAVGAYVISMTHDVSDLVEILLLQHFVGVNLDIAPLFETLDDLNHAPKILTEVFGIEAYRNHLRSRGDHQMIMLGYSDSNKDCGYLTANWALFQSQETISNVCREAGLGLTLFHGRGGSIARGGGPAAKAILAQPCGLYDSKIRVTEQGEVLSTRYHDPDLALRILEQMAYGVLLGAYAAQGQADVPKTWRDSMETMAETSFFAYRDLVHRDPDFIEFWKNATPIEEISGLKLGSRPTFRKATKSVEDLRAIPWVFSWMQSRFGFPGWYGLGSALTAFAAKGAAEKNLLSQMYKEWMFFKATIDNAQLTLQKADIGIAKRYASLVEDDAIRERVLSIIEAEFHKTVSAILEVTGQKALLEQEPVLAKSVQLRNPYIDPLNYIQVSMIQRFRSLPDKTTAEAEALRSVIELTISGVSAGIKNTG